MSEDKEKITLQIKNVSAKSRYVFNDLCKHTLQDRGDVISDLMIQFVKDELGSDFVDIAVSNFEYSRGGAYTDAVDKWRVKLREAFRKLPENPTDRETSEMLRKFKEDEVEPSILDFE